MSFGRPDLGMEFQSAQHQYRHGTLERLRDFDLTDWAKRAGIGLAEGDTFTGRDAQLMDPTVVSSLIGTARDVERYHASIAAREFLETWKNWQKGTGDDNRIKLGVTSEEWEAIPEKHRESFKQFVDRDFGDKRKDMLIDIGPYTTTREEFDAAYARHRGEKPKPTMSEIGEDPRIQRL
jgi:hypothetical protein